MKPEESIKADGVPETSGDRIKIEISPDEMEARITFNLPQEELDLNKREKLIREVAVRLRQSGVSYGFRGSLFSEELEAGIPYLVASGQFAEDGADSIIRMFEIEEAKPETIESGKVDYYNLSLIQTVDANAWVGEREHETPGKDGMTVRGEVIKAKNGIRFPLHYDRKYVYEVEEEGKTVLYTREYGAVYYKGRDVSIMNPLVINGDVGFKTGNIVFDGYVIINGTICDGFYVEATNDIEVNGELGLGNIKGIVSKKGSIYIKGGILAKGGVKVEAAKNVYLKFIENVTVVCGHTAHIGFYCSNSTVTAREVIIDAPAGKIMGGRIKATTRVLAAEIGSEIEKKTTIEVTCFNRGAIKADIDKADQLIKDLKGETERVRNRLGFYNGLTSLTAIQDRMMNEAKARLDEIKGEIRSLNEDKEGLNSYLKARGDGEISVTKKLYNNTVIIMKEKQLLITSPKYAADIVFQDGKILQL
ncbi:MAG: DUF342 domain-containing protein [Clostridiales bacterium]|nr:DUF342 domain-containing protein [Clostridiales bacterium]